MRIFKDLELVEHLGSGISRITQFFPESCFRFTENFLRSTFPAIEPVHAEVDVEAPVEAPVAMNETERKILVSLGISPIGRSAMLAVLGYRQPTGNFKTAIERLLLAGLIERTLPDKPNSRLQKYRLTANGRNVLL